MKMRISTVRSPDSDLDLNQLHASTGLFVEGDDSIVCLKSGTVTAFIGGHVEGILKDDGKVERPTHDTLTNLLESNPLSEWATKLEGRFVALTIQDNGEALLCTDAQGRCDLYYTGKESFVFTTELSLLPGWPDLGPVDQSAVAHAYSVYGYRAPKKHTSFQNVSRLGIGQYFYLSGGSAMLKDRPFQPCPPPAYTNQELDTYTDIFLDTLRLRASSEGNVVYLSSGWDSTSILAGLVHLFGNKKVRAVIGRMRYANRSGVINQFELDRAKAVADYFNVPLEICELDYRNNVEKVLGLYDRYAPQHELTSATVLNHLLLADHVANTRQGNEVAFVGEYSDGAHNLGFSQFATIFHPMLEFREYSDKMASYLYGPTFLNQFSEDLCLQDPIYGLFRERAKAGIFDKPADTAIGRRKQMLASFYLRSNRLPLWSMENVKVLTESGQQRYTKTIEAAYLEEASEEMTSATHYAWLLHLYQSFHWQGGTVACIELAGEAMGVPIAMPFGDSRMIQYLSYMPETWGRSLDLKPTKFPLKWMLENRIDYPLHLQTGPHSYLYDVDHTFSHSAELLYGSAFKPHWQKTISEGKWRERLSPEVFDLSYLDGVANNYISGHEDNGADMNTLFSIAMMSMLDRKPCSL